MNNKFRKAKWIGIPRAEFVNKNIYQGDLNNRFAYFALDFELDRKSSLELLISAAARYRLWINGQSVLSGPCKGDRYRQYYDEVNVSGYLRCGKNRIAVQVLGLDSYIVNNMMENGDVNQPLVAYAGLPLSNRLAVEGMVFDEEGTPVGEITTGIAPWKVYLEGAYTLICEQPYLTWMGALAEWILQGAVSQNWKNPDYFLEGFAETVILEAVDHTEETKKIGNTGVLIMKEREIPQMYEKQGKFVREIIAGELSECREGWREIPAYTKKEFIFDAGVIKNGFMKYGFWGGKNARVRMTYAERFISKNGEIRKDDFRNGILEGFHDEILPDGDSIVYEPFWYRTFRYVKMEIETAGEPLQVNAPCFMETGYPIQVSARFSSSEAWVKDSWEICVRTVKRCMNETYMDCPYYEQMQFPMDTRLQALYTYLLSGDTRLAKKALKDFHYSMTPDGLIQGKYPGSHTQIISTFSLYYIYMMREYYMWTEDGQTIRRFRPDLDLITDYYERKKNARGLVENLGYWEFVDWREPWDSISGAPLATRKGPSTIINLMFAYALGCGADLLEATGRSGVAQEYRCRQGEICETVQRLCWSEERQMYREGPDVEQYTIHAQAWAVLNGMVKGEKAGNLMECAVNSPDVIRNSFSTSFEIFEALKLSGRYHLASQILELWKELPGKGCTTCPEVPVNSRSECHAWSAQPIYEYVHHILGIRVLEKGWKRIEVCPDFSILKDYKGSFVTPRGMFSFSLEEQGNACQGVLELPENMRAELVFPDGKRVPLHAGKNIIGQMAGGTMDETADRG